MPVVTGRTSSGNGTERTAGHRPPLLPTDCNKIQNKSYNFETEKYNGVNAFFLVAFITLLTLMHLADPFIKSDLHLRMQRLYILLVLLLSEE